jgi:hypothetical protein
VNTLAAGAPLRILAPNTAPIAIARDVTPRTSCSWVPRPGGERAAILYTVLESTAGGAHYLADVLARVADHPRLGNRGIFERLGWLSAASDPLEEFAAAERGFN